MSRVLNRTRRAIAGLCVLLGGCEIERAPDSNQGGGNRIELSDYIGSPDLSFQTFKEGKYYGENSTETVSMNINGSFARGIIYDCEGGFLLVDSEGWPVWGGDVSLRLGNSYNGDGFSFIVTKAIKNSSGVYVETSVRQQNLLSQGVLMTGTQIYNFYSTSKGIKLESSYNLQGSAGGNSYEMTGSAEEEYNRNGQEREGRCNTTFLE